MTRRKKIGVLLALFIPIITVWRIETYFIPLWLDQVIATLCIIELGFMGRER